MTVHPGKPNQGIVFIRADLEGAPEIPAGFRSVLDTQLATTLGIGRITVSTVEHLMAAFAGLGVDNAVVEVSGPEIPILDGSSAHFTEAMTAVGLETQLAPRTTLVLKRKVEVHLGEKWAVAEPAFRLEVHSSIEWDHPAIGYQEYRYVQGRTSFLEIAAARTFGFMKDVEALRRLGLIRGGSLDNAVVLDEAGVLNSDGLRFSDEFVRHKVLDALGDLKLAGIEIAARFRLHRSGHDVHHQILTAIFRDPSNYEIVTHTEEPSASLDVRTALAAATQVAARVSTAG